MGARVLRRVLLLAAIACAAATPPCRDAAADGPGGGGAPGVEHRRVRVVLPRRAEPPPSRDAEGGALVGPVEAALRARLERWFEEASDARLDPLTDLLRAAGWTPERISREAVAWGARVGEAVERWAASRGGERARDERVRRVVPLPR